MIVSDGKVGLLEDVRRLRLRTQRVRDGKLTWVPHTPNKGEVCLIAGGPWWLTPSSRSLSIMYDAVEAVTGRYPAMLVAWNDAECPDAETACRVWEKTADIIETEVKST